MNSIYANKYANHEDKLYYLLLAANKFYKYLHIAFSRSLDLLKIL